jgi:imidazolonepropionase-like amidohydrolase
MRLRDLGSRLLRAGRHIPNTLSAEAGFTIVEAIAVSDGRISAVGASKNVLQHAGPDTVTIEVNGKPHVLVVPLLAAIELADLGPAEADLSGERA